MKRRKSNLAREIKAAKEAAKAISKEHGNRSVEAIRARRQILELENTQLTRQLAYQKREQAAMSKRLRHAILGENG